jgi:exopolysaccharide production protein ExoQ
MGSTNAVIAFSAFILIAFVIEARKRKKVSPAAWLPLFWMVICASRSISQWMNLSSHEIQDQAAYIAANLSGSPIDKVALGIIIVWGLIIIYKRRETAVGIFRNNKALLAFIIYLGISALWSDVGDVSFRRWIRLVGNFIMAAVLMTEPDPLESIRSIFRRTAYLLIPLSVMYIKHFPEMGVSYGSWTGEKMWHGVALQKNGLGHLCFVASYFIVWDAFVTLERKVEFKSLRLLFDGVILMMSLWLLSGPGYSESATSVGCLIMGVAMLVTFKVPAFKRNFAKIGFLGVLAIFLFFVLEVSFGITELIVAHFGRNMTFTDRTPLWNALIELGLKKPFGGYGYGGFWTVERIDMLRQIDEWAGRFTQGHSGYLELFVEGGLVAIVLLGVLLIAVLGKVKRDGMTDYNYAVFRLSLLVMILLANFTESNFPRERDLLSFAFFIIALNDAQASKYMRKLAPE